MVVKKTKKKVVVTKQPSSQRVNVYRGVKHFETHQNLLRYCKAKKKPLSEAVWELVEFALDKKRKKK